MLAGAAVGQRLSHARGASEDILHGEDAVSPPTAEQHRRSCGPVPTNERLVLYRGRYKNDALQLAEIVAKELPGCKPELTGEPANWTLTRYLMEGERREEAEARGFRNS